MSIRSIGSAGRLALAALLVQLLLARCVFAQSQGVIETKLDNGLTVLMKPVHAAPVFTASFHARTMPNHTTPAEVARPSV